MSIQIYDNNIESLRRYLEDNYGYYEVDFGNPPKIFIESSLGTNEIASIKKITTNISEKVGADIRASGCEGIRYNINILKLDNNGNKVRLEVLLLPICYNIEYDVVLYNQSLGKTEIKKYSYSKDFLEQKFNIILERKESSETYEVYDETKEFSLDDKKNLSDFFYIVTNRLDYNIKNIINENVTFTIFNVLSEIKKNTIYKNAYIPLTEIKFNISRIRI